MGAKLTNSIIIADVQVHPDHEDPTQFHYYPLNVPCKLGESLSEFKVTYWGIGPEYIVKIGDQFYDAFGAILAGKGSIDITEEQRTEVNQKIREIYGVEPKLSAITLTDVIVKPVFAGITLGINKGDIIFPEQFRFGSSFNFLVGSPQNQVFAHLAASKSGSGDSVDPSFGINIEAKGEFVGEPWKVTASADLKQVWSYVRKRFGGGGIKIGWIRIKKAEYERVMVDMNREQVINLNFDEGSLDVEKHGREIFEMGKDLLSSLNTESEFFKFEPHPNPSDPEESVYGWGVSLNAGYVDIDIDQSISWKKSIEYTGRVKIPIPSSLSLAVDCNDQTKQHFEDLVNMEEPCITQAKVDELLKRRSKANEKIEKQRDKLMDRLISGDIDPVRYRQIYAIISGEINNPTHEPTPEIAVDSIVPIENSESIVTYEDNGGQLNLVPIDPLSN
ncbi:hypothetical protein [Lysinibacillus sp. Y5S-8]|uniref:hypothetical protein n=1 Tax=Lysinibacillus sp. Y5S-8 TaxID=3122488 RepID=UPI0030D5CD9A